MLETSILSLSHKVYYPSPEKNSFESPKFVIRNAFNLDQSKLMPFGKGFKISFFIDASLILFLWKNFFFYLLE